MIDMKMQFRGIAVATLLTMGSTLAVHAEDAAAPKDTAAPAVTQTEAPASVPRPSIVPKTAEPTNTTHPSVASKSAEPAAAPDTTEPAPRRHRRYAYRHYRRYAYWEPFPVYLPHFHRHRIYWNRIPWFFF